MRTAKTTASIAALIGVGIVLVSLGSLYFVYGVLIAYVATCMIAWNNSEQSYSGFAFSMQCLAYFLMMIGPGFIVGLIVGSIFVQDPRAGDSMAWGAGIGAVVWGLPGLVIGGAILAITNSAIKRSADVT